MKKNNPLISIVMNCYNGEKYLMKSVQSVLNQTYGNWELIFWDNHSSDKSAKIIKNLKDKRIKYFKSKKFTNLYEARNLAISKCKGEFICFLDTDDWWIKEKLKTQINYIQKNKSKKVRFVFSNLYVYDNLRKNSKKYFNYFIPNGKITQQLLNDYKLGILTVMMKKQFFKDKRFNKNFNIIGDFDFFINLSIKESFFCIQKPLAYYRVHKKNYSKKLTEYIQELKKWLDNNSKKLITKKFSLKKIYTYYYKLKLKDFLHLGS